VSSLSDPWQCLSGLVKTFVVEAIGGVAVPEVHVGLELDAGPSRFLQNAANTIPLCRSTVHGTLQIGRRFGFRGAGPLQWVGAVTPHSRGRFSLEVPLSGTKVVDVVNV